MASSDNKSDSASIDVAQISQTLKETTLQQPQPKASSSSLPTTVTRSYSIQGVPTHTFCQVFSDRIVVGISQLPSTHVGNWTLCQAQKSEVSPKDIEFDLNVTLGDHNDAMLELYARRLTECVIERRMIPGTNRMVILLGMSLQRRQKDATDDQDREKFRLIVETLAELIQETLEVVLSQTR